MPTRISSRSTLLSRRIFFLVCRRPDVYGCAIGSRQHCSGAGQFLGEEQSSVCNSQIFGTPLTVSWIVFEPFQSLGVGSRRVRKGSLK